MHLWGCKCRFATLRAFDDHLSGPYVWTTRQCLNVDEMTAKGMTLNIRGRWQRTAVPRKPHWTPRPVREKPIAASR